MKPLSPNADAELSLGPARAYARLLTRTYSKSFFMATQLLPAHRRQDVYAVYGFCRYTDNIVDAPRDRDRATLRRELDAWKQEVVLAYSTGESQHPVLATFVRTMHERSIPLQHPLDLIAGVEMDLAIDRYHSFSDLRLFCYRVASVVGLMMTHVFGYHDSAAFAYAEDLGIGMQLTNILRDIDEDWRLHKKIYLPIDEMQDFGLSEEQVAEGRLDDVLRSFLGMQVNRAHSYFESAEPGIPMLHKSGQRAVRAASRLYQEILHEIERRNYDVFSRRPVVPGIRKIATLGYLLLPFSPPSRNELPKQSAPERKVTLPQSSFTHAPFID
jgi:15-cis-phytoene synthase